MYIYIYIYIYIYYRVKVALITYKDIFSVELSEHNSFSVQVAHALRDLSEDADLRVHVHLVTLDVDVLVQRLALRVAGMING